MYSVNTNIIDHIRQEIKPRDDSAIKRENIRGAIQLICINVVTMFNEEDFMSSSYAPKHVYIDVSISSTWLD